MTMRPALPVAAGAPSRAVGRLAVRQVRRGAAIVAVLCAGMSALVASQYQSTFRGQLDGPALRALAENPAVRILFGTPVALDDPGGFTVWRTGAPVMVLAGVWMLLAVTRMTRGEEDAGRVDLLLAGRLRVVDVVTRCLLAAAGAALMVSVGVGLGLSAVGADAVGTVVYAVAVLGVVGYFATAGLLAAQVMPTRSAAVGVTVALLAVGLLLRMLSDAVSALAWSAWLSPFGLTARAAPYADNRVLPLVMLAGFSVAFAGAALVAARHRDVGGGLIRISTARPPRTAGLSSLAGFVVRRGARTLTGWAAGIAAYFLIVGALIASILEFLTENPRFAELADAAGFASLGSANGFAAALFSLLTIPTGLYAATRLGGFVTDEHARRWTALLATPLTRARLAGTEIAVVSAGLVALHAVAGVAMWLGGVATGAPLSFDAALAGALNAVPLAWLSVGSAALAVGWLPSAVVVAGALPVVGGFLLNVVTQSGGAPAWVVDLSPFTHLAAVPDTPPNWASSAFVAVGAVLTAVGLIGYHRRDLCS